MDLIDVIILANNKSREHIDLTRNTIDTLRKHTDAKLNIIIVESNPGSDEVFESCEVIKPNKKFNYGEFVNIGYDYCKGDWVLILNNDLEFTPGWWTEVKKVYDNNPTIQSFSPYEPNFHGRYYFGYFNDFDNIYLGFEVPYRVSGWCIIHRREILEKIGKFDPLFNFYFIDDDYGKRCQYHGIKHALVKSSVVYHRTSQSHDTIPDLVTQCAMDSAKEKFKEKWKFFQENYNAKVKMVHLLLNPRNQKDLPDEMWNHRIQKQNLSIQHWRKLADRFSSYCELYLDVNREDLPSENCAEPGLINASKNLHKEPPVLSYGHYGAYAAHRQAIMHEFTEGIDALLVVEGDVIFDFEESVLFDEIQKAVKFGFANSASLLTFGKISYGLASYASKTRTEIDFGEFKKIDHFLCAHCYLVFQRERLSIQEKLEKTGWHAWDIWLYWNYDRRVPIYATSEPLVYEPEGVSMIDYQNKNKNL